MSVKLSPSLFAPFFLLLCYQTFYFSDNRRAELRTLQVTTTDVPVPTSSLSPDPKLSLAPFSSSSAGLLLFSQGVTIAISLTISLTFSDGARTQHTADSRSLGILPFLFLQIHCGFVNSFSSTMPENTHFLSPHSFVRGALYSTSSLLMVSHVCAFFMPDSA